MIKSLTIIIIKFFDYFYQRKMIIFLKKKGLNKLDTLFDVGGHKGETIELFLKNFLIERIISFEASHINFKNLEKNKINYEKKFKNTQIITENICLGAGNKEMLFKQFDESSSSTLSNINENSKYYRTKFRFLNFSKKEKVFETFKVKTKTLNNYIEENAIESVSFLKIDTEGHEYEILKGLGEKIKFVKTILFEHHYNDMIKKEYTFSDINNLLKKNNFKQVYKAKMPFRRTFEYIYSKNELLD
tara:strand:+ start:456 stop:1190 length:735 start_codon:yes stop_codon:yes gene_type:complete